MKLKENQKSKKNNMSNQQYETLLTAVRNGDYKQLQLIMKKKEGIDVNIHDSNDDGSTVLHYACRYCKNEGSHLQAVEFLLAHGAQVNSADNHRRTPLHLACENGNNVDIVKLLIDNKAEINSKDEYGVTPLFNACENDHVDIVKLLIDADADLNIQTNAGYTALHMVIEEGDICVDIIKLLIDADDDLNRQQNDDNGETPLFWAIQHEHVSAVKLLIDANVNINIQNKDGETVLNFACQIDGHHDIIKSLIDAYADLNIQDDHGNTPLHNAVGSTEVVKLLINANANLNIQNTLGYTALHMASVGGCTDTVQMLLWNGADMNVKAFDDDKTAEDKAHEKGLNEILECFQHFIEMRRQSFAWIKRRRQRQTRSV